MRMRAQKVVGFLTSGSLLWLGLVLATMSSAANQFAPPVKRVGNVIGQAGPGMTIKGEAPDGECRRSPHNISLTRHQSSASLFARWTGLTLEDMLECFNLILENHLIAEAKQDLVAFHCVGDLTRTWERIRGRAILLPW